jgi:hypothetical protein
LTAPLRVLEPGRRRRRPGARAFVFGLIFGLFAWAALVGLYFVAADLARASSSPTLAPSTIAYWDRVARCETGGQWRGLGRTYQGGLGFYWATWDSWAGELGLEARYPDAGDAPRLVQIRVADYGRRVHRGYWGCA